MHAFEGTVRTFAPWFCFSEGLQLARDVGTAGRKLRYTNSSFGVSHRAQPHLRTAAGGAGRWRLERSVDVSCVVCHVRRVALAATCGEFGNAAVQFQLNALCTTLTKSEYYEAARSKESILTSSLGHAHLGAEEPLAIPRARL